MIGNRSLLGLARRVDALVVGDGGELAHLTDAELDAKIAATVAELNRILTSGEITDPAEMDEVRELIARADQGRGEP